MKATVAVECGNWHGEGALWSQEHGLVMWTDIHGKKLWTLHPETGRTAHFDMPDRLCCFAPRAGRPATEIVAAFAGEFALYDMASGRRTTIAAFEPALPSTRLNDGRTDRQGRFIAGGMDEANVAPISAVYRIDPDLSVTRLIPEVGCANSTCFSPDGTTMYFADSPTHTLRAYPYDARTGALGASRTVARVDGIPDGSCVDAEGFVWTAVWEGYRVERRAPDGRLDRVVDLPVAKPTCCCFGGRDLATLYITTSRLEEPQERLAREPLAGHLFSLRPGVKGLADTPFAG